MRIWVALAFVLAAAVARAQETQAGAWAWRVLLTEGGQTQQVWGGRVAANVALYRGLHVVGRVDASALPGEELDLAAGLDGYQSIEAHGGAYYDVRPGLGLAAVYGITARLEGDSASPRTWGAGVRLGRGAGYVYALVGRHEAAGDGVRGIVVAQVPLWKAMSAVADLVTGDGGFARVGIAVAMPTGGEE